MTRSDLTVMAFVLLISRAAHADVFDVPYEYPVLSIAVPASWNPNHSEDGVDAAAPYNTVFFSIYTSNADSIAGVQQESLAILTRNGMKIARQRAPERSQSFAGLGLRPKTSIPRRRTASQNGLRWMQYTCQEKSSFSF